MRGFAFLFAFFLCLAAMAHDGPDPVLAWDFHPRYIKNGILEARLGPSARIAGSPQSSRDVTGQSLLLNGKTDILAVDGAAARPMLPARHLTVEAWVAVNTPHGYGGIAGYFQDNGDAETGWILGYNDRTFTFGLASKGADDGNGKMTYLAARTPYEAGRIFHVVGTYDGEEMRIYVNGRLEARSQEQKGDILYPAEAPFSLGRYHDRDENNLHEGRLVRVAVYDLAATAPAITHLFEHHKDWAAAAPLIEEPQTMEFVVQPYLQFPTQTTMTVMWETTRTSTSVVYVGPGENAMKPVTGEPGRIHRVDLKDLQPEGHYVYRVESVDDQGRKVTSELFTFRTAGPVGNPIRFCVVGDTQTNPPVAKRIAEHMWNERPDFFLIPGDLVGTGANKNHWVTDFFAAMRPLLSRVPLLPVLGNHEGDARLYYDYMALPTPEYYYRFVYGDAEFFVIDSNRNVAPGSEQYQWLDAALASSTARWKFVTHHHPPYSSDEDDYGNLWKGQSVRGDVRMRALTALYEKHNVDIVFTGHIHSYERTWPMVQGRARERGPIYIVCGGGGGGLETHGPTRPAWSHTVRHGHHYTVITLLGGRLSFRAFDIEGRLFDTFTIEKD